MIPSDGTIVEGIASVDESAITGESAPVIREAGGDRSAVTGGTRVLSDRIVIEITQNPGETFLDRMISLVESASRQKTPNEIALNILLASLTLIFLIAVVTLQPYADLLGRVDRGHRAHRVAGLPHPHHDRRPAQRDRNRRDRPSASEERPCNVGRAVEAAGDVDTLLLDKTGTITLGNRQATEFLPAPGVTMEQLAEPRTWPVAPTRRPRDARSWRWRGGSALRGREVDALSGPSFPSRQRRA